MDQPLQYPEARRDESIVDDYFGKKIADPYRWLEDPYSAETKKFVDAENQVTRTYFESDNLWHKINQKLTEFWNYPKCSVPVRHGDYYYSYRNSGLQNQDVLFKQKTLQSELIEVLDPNKLSADGSIVLAGTSFSPDGNLFAYGLSESESDWVQVKIRDVRTGEDLPDVLTEVKFIVFSLISWTHDNKGFFYCWYRDHTGKTDGSHTQVDVEQKLYYHQLGDSQDKDVLVAEFPAYPWCRMSPVVSDCGKYLVLRIIKECRGNLLFFADLEKTGEIRGKFQLTPMNTDFDADYEYIANIGSKAIFRTNKNASNYRLISVDLNDPSESKWTTLLPEDKRDVLHRAYIVDANKLVVNFLHDVKSVLRVYDLCSGKLIREFPSGIGQLTSFSSNGSKVFYKFESFLTPGKIYNFDFTIPDSEPKIIHETKLRINGFDENNFTVEQVFYSTYDGTKVPMFIIQKKTPSKNGAAKPCILYAYGGFGISLLPSFNATWLTFVDAFDGVLAIPNIRGGGEYGTKWHDGGRLLNKQTIFDDFQAAAEYLVKHKYTEHKKIAIQGWSNGGLMIGACINQRPELFGAAVVQVGVLDMLRYPQFTIGPLLFSEYGSPSKKVHFENLLKYSPLHNIRTPSSSDTQYPATYIITAENDDRVSPLHSLKFAAALRHAVKDNQFQTNPILLRVYNNAGHGSPTHPTDKEIEQSTDILTFLYKSLNVTSEI